MIRIVIADDHHLVRQSIVSLIDRWEDMEVVGEAANGIETIRQIQQKKPDIAIVDVAMPLMNGVETSRRIQSMYFDVNVIFLSMHSDESLVCRSLRTGAKGYLLKDSVSEELMIAIRSVYRGDVYLSPAIAKSVLVQHLRSDSTNNALSLLDSLTSREREVLQLIVEGCTSRVAAQFMDISTKTVEKHRASLMNKLGVNSLSELILVALRNGLVYVYERPA